MRAPFDEFGLLVDARLSVCLCPPVAPALEVFGADVAAFVCAVLAVRALVPSPLRLALARPADEPLAAALRGAAADFADTTPLPENCPGFALAATDGLPWFTEANCARFVLRLFLRGSQVLFSCSALRSAAVGSAFTPPSPPL